MDAAVLTGYDTYNSDIGAIDYIEVQWSRKWKEFGTWSAYMRLEDYNKIKAVRYVKLAGRPEVGVRMKTEYEDSVKGEFVTISGLFLHQLLNWASSAMTYNITSRTALLRYADRTCGSWSSTPPEQFTTEYPEGANSIRAFARVRFIDYNNLPSSMSGTIEAKTGVADALNSILSDAYSFVASEVISANNGRIGMIISFKAGRDKSSLVFSRENGNVSEMRYSVDDSAIRSTIRVCLKTDPNVDLGSFGWDEYYLTTGDAKQYTGDTKENVYIAIYEQEIAPFESGSGSGIQHLVNPIHTIDGQSDFPLTSANWSQIKSELQEQGKLEGLNHYKEQAASFKAIQVSGCQYLTNYDLGDLISVQVPIQSDTYKARIMGVNEVHRGNHCEVDLTIGKLIPRTYRYKR